MLDALQGAPFPLPQTLARESATALRFVADSHHCSRTASRRTAPGRGNLLPMSPDVFVTYIPGRSEIELSECLMTLLSELHCQLCGHLPELDETVVPRHRVHLEADQAALFQDHHHADHIASSEIVEFGAAFHANGVLWT